MSGDPQGAVITFIEPERSHFARPAAKIAGGRAEQRLSHRARAGQPAMQPLW